MKREKFIAELHDLLAENVQRICGKDKYVGVCLSGGIDSMAVLFTCLELGKKVTAYSFHVEGVESRDFLAAKTTSLALGVEFTPVIVPRELDLKVLCWIIERLKLTKKTQVECLYPLYFINKYVTETVLLTGATSDGYYGLSRSAMQNYDKDIHAYREKHFTESDIANEDTFAEMCGFANVVGRNPFHGGGPAMLELYQRSGLTWDELNKPEQKYPLREAFRGWLDREGVKLYPHTPMQCGDSEVRELFLPLRKMGPWGTQEMGAIYRRIGYLSTKLLEDNKHSTPWGRATWMANWIASRRRKHD